MNEEWPQIRQWRRAKREQLVAQRLALPQPVRREWSACIEAHIRAGFELAAGTVIGFCWPFKNEFDMRFVLRDFRARGAIAVLPLVAEKSGPLQFRKWWPGAPMTKGVYDIPFPQDTERLTPDIAFVPMNGFDERGYRLGYGGGYFDRTLAALSPRPVAVGIAFECARLPTIHPQPHDIAMDFIVTEAGVHIAQGTGPIKITAAECGGHLKHLMAQRGLPRHSATTEQGYSSPVCYAAEFPGYFGEDVADG